MSENQFKWVNKMSKAEMIRIIETVKPEGEMSDDVLPRLKAGTSLRSIEQAKRLDEWLDTHQPKYDTFKEDLARNVELNRQRRERVKVEADSKAALARLQQYANEMKLAETAENANLVAQYIDKNLGGYWSEANVDAAVQAVQRQLRWKMF